MAAAVALLTGVLALALAGCGRGGRPSPGRAGQNPSHAVRVLLTVSPAAGLWDRSRRIVISGLRRGQVVTLRATSPRPDGVWTSAARFRAGSDGKVDLTHQGPVSGSYRGVSPMGPLWSEKLARPGRGPRSGRVTTTLSVQVAGRTVTSAHLTQLLNGPGVSRSQERVASAGFFGIYYSPPAATSRAPAVVLWTGSNGDLQMTPDEAALLASHGIPALALAYFDDPGLPCRLQSIPLEYFVRAIHWLRAQRQVDPRRVWAWGGSRGSEAALLLAAHFPTLLRGVVAWAPTSYVHGSFPGSCQSARSAGAAPAWTLHGTPIPDGTPIPVHQIRANLLLVAGEADVVWPSRLFASQIMSRLPNDGATHLYLHYPGAGHIALGIPFTPPSPFVLAGGGTPAGYSGAYARDWPATIDFIRRH